MSVLCAEHSTRQRMFVDETQHCPQRNQSSEEDRQPITTMCAISMAGPVGAGGSFLSTEEGAHSHQDRRK